MPGISEQLSSEAQFNDALEIARVLHREELTATRIASTAVAKLPYAAVRQARRFYYETEDSARTRSYADDSLLLTQIVFAESTQYERREEAAGRIDPQLFHVRAVKQLIQSSLKRNSFYAAVAVGRVLHDYSTSTVMDLYAHIAPHRSHKKESSHFRRAKAVLMQELAERFGALIKLEYGPDGRRYEPDRMADDTIIRRALALFAPRRTQHTPPPLLEAASHRDWRQEGTEAWNDELKRLHALIDPTCFDDLSKHAIAQKWYGFRARHEVDGLTYRILVPRLNASSLPVHTDTDAAPTSVPVSPLTS